MNKLNPWSEAVARYLEVHGKTQAWLAERADKAESTVSYWCSGKVPRDRNVLHRVEKITRGEVKAVLAVA